jgi:hypothetical protein
VVVAGWQWYRWIEEIKAVRMVPDREWQWQYWRSCGGWENMVKNRKKNWVRKLHEEEIKSGGAGSGSGRVAVVPLDRGDQGGSNGTR